MADDVRQQRLTLQLPPGMTEQEFRDTLDRLGSLVEKALANNAKMQANVARMQANDSRMLEQLRGDESLNGRREGLRARAGALTRC